LLGIGYGFIVWQVTSSIGRDQRAELTRITEIRGNAVYALQKLKREAIAPPCFPDFLAEMQRVAFLPDGLNEFLSSPNGRVECSMSRPKFETPVPLGAPDVDSSGANAPSLRIDRDLALIGRSGTMGTIAQLGGVRGGDPALHALPERRNLAEKGARRARSARQGMEHRWRSWALPSPLPILRWGRPPDDGRQHAL
jgi:hypothetical protein